MRVVFNSNVAQFIAKVNKDIDSVMESLAGEIEREAKMVVPHNIGRLQSSIRSKKIKEGHYQVTAGEFPALEYAGVREFQENVKFSKPGKKAHFLRDSGDEVSKKGVDRFRSHLK